MVISHTLAVAVFTALLLAMSAHADILSRAAFRIELEDGWEHRVEVLSEADHGWGDLIRIHYPNGPGVLSMRSYAGPAVVGPDALRNLTNLPLATPLTLQRWGKFEGYQYEYVEAVSFYRQWWLANENTLLVITYRCDAELSGLETAAVDRMVSSLDVAGP